MVEGGGFEPPKSSDDRFTVCSLWPLGNPSRRRLFLTYFLLGAGDGTRTRNLLITSQLLYQLSYASQTPHPPGSAKAPLPKKREVLCINDFLFYVKIFLIIKYSTILPAELVSQLPFIFKTQTLIFFGSTLEPESSEPLVKLAGLLSLAYGTRNKSKATSSRPQDLSACNICLRCSGKWKSSRAFC